MITGRDTYLNQMIIRADQAYPDHLILAAFDNLEIDVASPRFLLASYIAGMMQELHDPNSSEAHNLQRIITALETGADDLNLVVAHLQRMHYALAHAS